MRGCVGGERAACACAGAGCALRETSETVMMHVTTPEQVQVGFCGRRLVSAAVAPELCDACMSRRTLSSSRRRRGW